MESAKILLDDFSYYLLLLFNCEENETPLPLNSQVIVVAGTAVDIERNPISTAAAQCLRLLEDPILNASKRDMAIT